MKNRRKSNKKGAKFSTKEKGKKVEEKWINKGIQHPILKRSLLRTQRIKKREGEGKRNLQNSAFCGNSGGSYKQTVEKGKKVCYNNFMVSMQSEISKNIQFIDKKHQKEFDFYSEFLLSYNQKVNLTAITEEKEVRYKHFLDSLMGEFLLKKGDTVADVGAGAGFPSLPLAIVRPDVRFVLFESIGKKCEFLRSIVKELHLSNVEVYQMRAEEAARGEFRETFSVCVARAVARMNSLTEYCLPLVKQGGKMIAYKADEEEIEEAKRAISLLGGEKTTVYRYELPEETGTRILAVVEKGRKTPEKYPRGQGKERKNPL